MNFFGLEIEPKISVGTLFHLGVLLVALIAIYYRIRERIVKLEIKVSTMYQWWQHYIERRQNNG